MKYFLLINWIDKNLSICHIIIVQIRIVYGNQCLILVYNRNFMLAKYLSVANRYNIKIFL